LPLSDLPAPDNERFPAASGHGTIVCVSRHESPEPAISNGASSGLKPALDVGLKLAARKRVPEALRWLLPVLATSVCALALLPVTSSRSGNVAPPPAPLAPPPPAPRTSDPPVRTASDKPPPIPMLATRGELFMVATEDGKTSCQRWLVHDVQAHGIAYLTQDTNSIRFENHGSQLTLLDYSNRIDSGGTSGSCGRSFAVREVADGLELQEDRDQPHGGRWFAREADCAGALARQQRVAMDLASCMVPREPTLQEMAASQRKFEAILRDGGITYEIVDFNCVAIHVTASKPVSRDVYQGSMWIRPPQGGRTGYAYALRPDSFDFTVMGHFTEWEDGGGGAEGDLEKLWLVYERDSVRLNGMRYLSLASCKTARDKAREKARWLPERIEPPDDSSDTKD
jgi:hypothetical protein